MEDKSIVALFHQRNEQALAECKTRYGAYVLAIANRILESQEDAEEVLNDTLLRAWNAIPPDQPQKLSLYLGTLSRNLAFDKYKEKARQKRGKGETALALEELEAIFAAEGNPEKALLDKELSQAINRFLSTLPERERNILILRYFFVYSYKEIATHHGMKENHVRTLVSRALKKLKTFLEKEDHL